VLVPPGQWRSGHAAALGQREPRCPHDVHVAFRKSAARSSEAGTQTRPLDFPFNDSPHTSALRTAIELTLEELETAATEDELAAVTHWLWLMLASRGWTDIRLNGVAPN
jgi:hypothetical protein